MLLLKRWLYAIRYMAWLAIWKEGGPNRPFAYYLHRYDRRQENFRMAQEAKEREQ